MERARRRVLVLGGSGFVGSRVVTRALQRGFDVVAVSRRGPIGQNGGNKQDTGGGGSLTWTKADASQAGEIAALVSREGPFDAVVHCVGVLFDGTSALRRLNWVVSGSRSVPDAGVSYDRITRRSAFELKDAIAAGSAASVAEVPFVFLSAAEAGWPQMPGGPTVEAWLAPGWLKRYLTAKRAVEAKLVAATEHDDDDDDDDDNNKKTRVRPVILRPSFVYQWTKLDVLLPVLVYYVLSWLRVPFIDRPVRVEAVSSAVVEALEDGGVRGVQRYGAMDALAAAGDRRWRGGSGDRGKSGKGN